jgi:hypothetical protein
MFLRTFWINISNHEEDYYRITVLDGNPGIGYAQTITTFILVRHAEKVMESGSDPELKPEGVKRAESFVGLFTKSSIDAIYSTNYKRTRNTVTPLANAKSLTVNSLFFDEGN